MIAGVVVGVWLCSACSTPGSVLPVVKIGLVAPFEGPQRAMAYDALFATKLALRRFNEQQRNAGGPLVELVALNDDGQAIRSRQVAQEMAVDPAIVGVIGPWSAEAAAAAAKTYREANLPVVYPGLGLGQLDTTGESTYLNVCATDAEVGAKAAEYVAQQGPSQRIVVVAPDGASGNQRAVTFVETLDRLGVPIVASVTFGVDLIEIAESVQTLNPDVIFFSGQADEIIGTVAALGEAGVNALCLVGPELDRIDLMQVAGPATATMAVVALAPSWRDLGENHAFVATFLATANKPPGTQAILAYDAANVLLETIAEVSVDSRPTRENILARLQSADGFPGLTGDLRFDVYGNRVDAPLWIRALDF